MATFLFVCTANRFRSPIAAACFEKELSSRKADGRFQVGSAGTWTTDGLLATPEAISHAARLDLDLNNHVSRSITAELMATSDVIIVMEQGQLEALRSEFPRDAHKVHLLAEAATGVAYDIPDPIASGTGSEVAGEIDGLIHSGFERICALSNTT